jgi:hypothetical protein
MYGRRGGIAQCAFKIGDDTLQQQREIFQVEVIEPPSAQKFFCRLELSELFRQFNPRTAKLLRKVLEFH